MRIFKVNTLPLNNRISNNIQHDYTENRAASSACSNDCFSFTGKKISKNELEKIDNYILNLQAIKAVRENAVIKVKAAEEILSQKLSSINEQIKPLLNDEGFLWIIEPKESKSRLARFVVDSSHIEGEGYNKKIHNKTWEKVYNSIRNRILTGNPEEIKFEEPNKLDTCRYHLSLIHLKDLIAKKTVVLGEHRNKINEIDRETFEKMMPFSEKNSNISLNFIYKTPADRNVEDFNKLVAKRAIETNPELKSVRDKAYNYHFLGFKDYYSTLPIGQQKQRAANFANQEVISRLEGTSNTDRPFWRNWY